MNIPFNELRSGYLAQQQAIDEPCSQECCCCCCSALNKNPVHAGKVRYCVRRCERFPAFRSCAMGEKAFAGGPVFKSGKAHIEARRIGIKRAPPHNHHIRPRPLKMAMRARCLSGDPAAFAVRKGNATIERRRELERNKGPSVRLAEPPARHCCLRFLRHQAGIDCNAIRPQFAETRAIGAFVRIRHG